MEREGWDFNNRRFFDFDDNNSDQSSPKPNHTQKNMEQLSDLKVKRKPEIQEQEQIPINSHENSAITADIGNNEINDSLSFNKSGKPSKELLYTYAFCKVFGKLSEVHYEQIDQLALPFFQSNDKRSIESKTNILIRNQCMVRKQSNKKWFELIPSEIQRFKNEYQHLEEILEKEVNKDFLDALTP